MENLETFVQIEGFNGYKIGNFGTVLGLKGKVMNPSPCRDGYLQANLYRDGKQIGKLVHILVAEHFLTKPQSEEKLYIDHIDHDRLNNRADNLQWLTHKENIQKSLKADRRRTVFKCGDIAGIREEFATGVTITWLAKKYNVAHSTMSKLVNGKTWSTI